MSGEHIFVVEDEGIVSLDIQNRLRRAGYLVAGTAASGLEAIATINSTQPDLVLMDIKLQGEMDGIETAHHVRQRFNIPVIYLTAYADEETLKRSAPTEAFGYLLKPFKERELVVTIQMALMRHRLEKQLKESEEWFSTTLRSIGDAVIATDENGRIKFMNPLAEKLTGWEQKTAVGIHSDQIFQIIDATTRQPNPSPVEKVLKTGKVAFLQNNTLLVARNGRETHIDDSAAPILDEQGHIVGVVLTFRDVSERKQAERVLLQAHKMESVGILAGGVAHDFNNLLVAILGQTSLALTKLAADNAATKHLEKAVKAAEQAAELTKQLLAYSGRGHFSRKSLCLNDFVQSNQQILAASVPKSIHIRLKLDETLPHIEADPSQMQQVVMNLILNAAEAIGTQEGTITIRTGTQIVQETDTHYWRHTGELLQLGKYTLLEVSDTGCGIEADMLPTVFEPFFTTKPSGRGLGLAAILGIVRGHQGGLHVESTPGQGTTFTLLFPISDQEPIPPVETAVIPTPVKSNGKVLVIDDEKYIHDLVTDTLALVDIEVLAALGGVAGVKTYQERCAEIGMVLLDLSMPDMGGAQVFQRLREMDPQVKVVLTSGYDKDDVMRHADWHGLADFIQKPYNLNDLIDTVKRHL